MLAPRLAVEPGRLRRGRGQRRPVVEPTGLGQPLVQRLPPPEERNRGQPPFSA
jgi:hypothetical protein